jgi:hypothetical protein
MGQPTGSVGREGNNEISASTPIKRPVPNGKNPLKRASKVPSTTEHSEWDSTPIVLPHTLEFCHLKR